MTGNSNILRAEEIGAEIPSPRKQLIEVLVFLFLILPSMVLSLFVVRRGSVGFVFVAESVILRDLSLIFLVLYFVWSNREPVHRIGWIFEKRRRDIILGIVLFVPVLYGANLLEKALLSVGFSGGSKAVASLLTPKSWPELLLAVILVTIVAFSEETIFRGYLMLRFEAITESPIWAAVLSSLIFSIGHGYEESAGLITIGLMGFVFSLIYLWRRSLVAPIVMHFLQDFTGIVLVPLLTGK
jgi:membrane protease YdiL (CAAX protease family)